MASCMDTVICIMKMEASIVAAGRMDSFMATAHFISKMEGVTKETGKKDTAMVMELYTM